jgi:general secretion pathway protein L
MTVVITRFPVAEADKPLVWRVTDGQWHACGPLSDFIPDIADEKMMALVSAAEARCLWSSLPDMQPRQAEGVAKLRVAEQSLGLVHTAARHVFDDIVVTASIAPAVMQDGLARLALRGLNPDIVIPFGLAVEVAPDHIVEVEFDGMTVLRGERFAIPDEAVFRDLLVGDSNVETIAADQARAMLFAASEHPLLNLREGLFAKRERKVLATAEQRKWIIRLAGALIAATLLLGMVTLAKYWSATSAENDRALAAAQRIDPSIQDITQAEAQLGRALQQKGLAQGRFAPLSAGLWRAVQASPNVSARELRFANDGLLTVVLAAPNADSINRALLAIQQDGYRITATPRQDSSGATLVDLTMRMP